MSQEGRARYEKPRVVDLGSIAAHTFMPITQGQSQSHKGFDHPNGDMECELSSSPGSAPGPGLCENG